MGELWGILLAAGSSTRLGRPKQLVQIDGQSALKRMTRVLGAVTGRNTLVVLGYDHVRLRRQLRDLHCTVVWNPEWKTGMASSLQIGIHALPESAAGALIVTCDQLELDAMDLEALKDAWLEQPDACAAAAYDHTLGVPVVFPRSQFSHLDALSGDRGAKSLLTNGSNLPVRQVDMPHAAFDLDTPEDLARMQRFH